jgi:hypothetical protein
MLRRVE